MIIYRNSLFIHIPKNAGTSIRNALQRSGEAFYMAKISKPGVPIRKGPNFYQPHVRYTEFPLLDDLWKFCVVRNPWERYVSMYAADGTSMPFVEYLSAVLAKIKFTQSWFLQDDYDFIIEFEHLNEGWKNVCRHIDFKYKPLPHFNTSAHGPYQEMYTPKLRERVESAEAEVIKQFSYRF